MRIDEPGSDTLDSADPVDVAEQHAELDDDAFDDDAAGAPTCRGRRIPRMSPSRASRPVRRRALTGRRVRGGR